MKRLATIVCITLFWLVVWQVASLIVNNPLLFCGPVEVFQQLALSCTTLDFWSTIIRTFVRITIGFIVACTLGILLGMLAERFRFIQLGLSPALHVIKSAPVVCIIALLLVWFGSHSTTSIVAALVVLPPFYYAVHEASLLHDQRLNNLAHIFRVSRLKQFMCVRLPQAFPLLRVASKNAAGVAWKAGVAAELIGLPLGSIGEEVYLAKLSLDSASIIGWTAVVILLGWLCERALVALVRASQKVPFWWLQRMCTKASVNTNPPSMPEAAEIEVRESKLVFAEHSITLSNDIVVAPHGKLALMAPSGSGKTSLFGALSGTLTLATDALYLRPPHAALSVVFQEPHVLESATADMNLAFTAQSDVELAYARHLLRMLIPDEVSFADKPLAQLSGGMRRRVEIARALAHPSSLILLDEPFNGLDDETKHHTAHTINEHLFSRTLIVATHMQEDATLLNADDVVKPF